MQAVEGKMSKRLDLQNLVAILFDKDGTLVDFDRTWEPINRQAARMAAKGDAALELTLLDGCGTDPETGRTRPDSMFASANAVEIARRMVDLGSAIPQAELTLLLDALFRQGAGSAVPIGDIEGLFGELGAYGYRLGIASSDNEESVRTTMRKFGIEGVVDYVAGYDSGHGVKPEAGMVLAFARQAQCEVAQVLMVGDNRHDIAMGRAAGAITVGVLTGTGTRETLEPLADLCLASVHDLRQILKR
jgi:phosphoglycolate phosphatase